MTAYANGDPYQGAPLPEVDPDNVYGSRPLLGISTDPPDPLLLDRLDPDSHTVLFGPGGVGKGTLASWWIGGLVGMGQSVLIVDYEDHPGEWARRCTAMWARSELEDVYHVSPTAATWGGAHGAIWDQARDLKRLADKVEATYIVVDSIVVACGAADPIDAGTAGRYAAALSHIGRPALSLAHVTKLEDGRYPFGSVFWHNLARVTWSLSRGQGGAILTNRKANNYPNQGRHLFTIEWFGDKPTGIREQPYAAKLAELIAEVLADGPLSAKDITTRLNEDRDEDEAAVKLDSVTKALRRGLKTNPMTFRLQDDLWRLPE